MIVSNNAIATDGLGDFFKSLGKNCAKVGKKLSKNVL